MQMPKKFHPKSKFSAEEDVKLRSLVNQYGLNNWQTIAQNMPNRNLRQCKERWSNYLSPQISKAPWTTDEDALIIQKVKELGSKWVQIAKFFNQRTDTSIKNRWLVLVRKNKKELLKQQTNKPIPTSISFQEDLTNNSFKHAIHNKSSETLLPPISSLPFIHHDVNFVETEIKNVILPNSIIHNPTFNNNQITNVSCSPNYLPPAYLLPPKKAILAVQTQIMFSHPPNAATTII